MHCWGIACARHQFCPYAFYFTSHRGLYVANRGFRCCLVVRCSNVWRTITATTMRHMVYSAYLNQIQSKFHSNIGGECNVATNSDTILKKPCEIIWFSLQQDHQSMIVDRAQVTRRAKWTENKVPVSRTSNDPIFLIRKRIQFDRI